MFLTYRRCVVACCLLAWIPAQPEAAQAQVEGQLSEKPIAVFYARNITEQRIMAYLRSLAQRITFSDSMHHDLENAVEDSKASEPEIQEPIGGFALYLGPGVNPSVESVSFRNVNDTNSAKRLLEAESQDNGDVTLNEMGDERYVKERRHKRTAPLPEGTDEATITATNRSISVGNGITQTSYEFSKTIEEEDGKKVIVQTTTSRSFHRVHDQFLYEGESEKLFSMSLPSAAEISAGDSAANDLGFAVYLDRIPNAVRQMVWNMTSSGFGMQMQQYDGESDSSYHMRRGSGDLGLGIAKAALLDIDFIDGSLVFANVDTPSILGKLRIRARNNGELGDKLQRAIGDSRFAPILHDNAAVTNHACVRLPEASSKALTATGNWLRESFTAEFRNDPATMTIPDTLANALAGIAEHQNLEWLLRVGWSEESAGVVYGGIQLHDDPQLLPGIFQLIEYSYSHLKISAESGFARRDQWLKMINDGDMDFIRIKLPVDAVEYIAESCGAQITHMYLAQQNSCLWFAAGGENAKEIIRQSVARCRQSNARRTPFLSARIDMEQWLTYPKDDPTGIAQMPDWLDQNSWWFPPNPYLAWATDFEGPDRKPRPLMHQAFDLGGSQQFSLTLNADESGLLLQMNLGEALANHMLARLLDFEDEGE